MKSYLFLIFIFTNYFGHGQNNQNCYELYISCYGECTFGFSQQKQETPPTTIKVVRKNEKVIVYGIFGRNSKYIDKEYRVDSNNMIVTRKLDEVAGIVASSNNYGPSERAHLLDMIKKGLVFAEVKYILSKCN